MPRCLPLLALLTCAAPAHAQSGEALGSSYNAHAHVRRAPTETELVSRVYAQLQRREPEEAAETLRVGLQRYPESDRLQALRLTVRRSVQRARAIGELADSSEAELERRAEEIQTPLYISTTLLVTGVLASVFGLGTGLVGLSGSGPTATGPNVDSDVALAAAISGALGGVLLIASAVWLGITDHERRRLDLALGRIRF